MTKSTEPHLLDISEVIHNSRIARLEIILKENQEYPFLLISSGTTKANTEESFYRNRTLRNYLSEAMETPNGYITLYGGYPRNDTVSDCIGVFLSATCQDEYVEKAVSKILEKFKQDYALIIKDNTVYKIAVDNPESSVFKDSFKSSDIESLLYAFRGEQYKLSAVDEIRKLDYFEFYRVNDPSDCYDFIRMHLDDKENVFTQLDRKNILSMQERLKAQRLFK